MKYVSRNILLYFIVEYILKIGEPHALIYTMWTQTQKMNSIKLLHGDFTFISICNVNPPYVDT